MYKITWTRSSDKYHKTFLLVPDVYALFEVYFIITGYGRNDGCTPVEIVVTNLNGDVLDMSKGLPYVASRGTYSSKDV